MASGIIDGIPAQTGDSRIMRSNPAGIPATYEEYRNKLISAGIPFDTFINPAGWRVLGALIGKALLLTDDTSAALGGAATVDAALWALRNSAQISKNGISEYAWFTGLLPVAQNWRDVTYGNGRFVAVGGGSTITSSTSNIAAYSYDGINWHSTTMPSSRQWWSVAYGGGRFVAVAFGSNVSAYSTDGITWTQVTLPSSTDWVSLAYGNGRFVAIATNQSTSTTTAVAYSTDGSSWSTASIKTAANTYMSFRSITYGGDKFVAVGYIYLGYATNLAAYSTDGITWTISAMPYSQVWHDVTYGNGRFVAVAKSTDVAAYSTNGINWTLASLPSAENWYVVGYAGDKFIALSDNTIAAISMDGVTWTSSTMLRSLTWHSTAYGNGIFVVVGQDSSSTALYFSTDKSIYTATDIFGNTIGGFTRSEHGTYIGTGTYGSANPNVLTFGFDVRCILIAGGVSRGTSLIMLAGASMSVATQSTSSSHMTYYSIIKNTVSWYQTVSATAHPQLNESGATYAYIAIG